MYWQELIVAAVVLAATAFLIRQSWKTWFSKKSGCGGGCGCAKKNAEVDAKPTGAVTTMVSVNELTQRIRGR